MTYTEALKFLADFCTRYSVTPLYTTMTNHSGDHWILSLSIDAGGLARIAKARSQRIEEFTASGDSAHTWLGISIYTTWGSMQLTHTLTPPA